MGVSDEVPATGRALCLAPTQPRDELCVLVRVIGPKRLQPLGEAIEIDRACGCVRRVAPHGGGDTRNRIGACVRPQLGCRTRPLTAERSNRGGHHAPRRGRDQVAAVRPGGPHERGECG
jgi:hypothetical protein